MTSLIFVHGTGGREAAYAATFQQIERVIAERQANSILYSSLWSDVSLYPCLWGDALGANLNAGGASIPDYEVSAGGQPIAAEPDGILLWEALYKDPLHEIRLLGLRPLQGQKTVPGRQTAAQEVQERVANLPGDAALVSNLNELEIGTVFVAACEWVAGKESKPFGLLLTTVARPLEGDYAAISRAIVAASRLLCKEKPLYPQLLWNERLRDEAVDAIAQALTQEETSRGVMTDWTKRGFRMLQWA